MYEGVRNKDSTAERRDMPQEKQDIAGSVRTQWALQRKGEPARSQEGAAAPRGRHFAQPANNVPNRSERMESDETADAASGLTGSATESMQQQGVQRQRRITGASGEMPAVPLRVSYPPALPYSRYNKRYLTGVSQQGGGTAGASSYGLFATLPITGAPAYSWAPFLACGLTNAFLSILWGVVVFLVAPKPLIAGDMWLTIGMALLGLIVLSNMVMVVSTAIVSMRNNGNLVKRDVIASSSIKVAFMLIADILIWVLSTALATLVIA